MTDRVREAAALRIPAMPGRIPLIALAAAGTRLALRRTESRWQIAGFCVAAFAIEAADPGNRASLRLLRPLLLCGAAAAGVVAVKAYLEPDAMHIDLETVRHHTKRVARATVTIHLPTPR